MRRILALSAMLSLAAVACTSGGTADDDGRLRSIGESEGELGIPVGPEPPPAEPGEALTNRSPLPAIDVVDVTSGATVNLGDLYPAALPTLIWFWAPH